MYWFETVCDAFYGLATMQIINLYMRIFFHIYNNSMGIHDIIFYETRLNWLQVYF